MRVLALHPGPAFSVADVFSGWVKALAEAGCQVAPFNLDDRLEFYEKALVADPMSPDGTRKCFTSEQAVSLAGKSLEAVCYEFWPDVVIVFSGFYLRVGTLDLLRARGHRVVLVHTESPYEDDRQVRRAQHADLNILNDPTNIGDFPAGTVYLPHAYDPDVHHPGSVDREGFCFVGTGYPSRVEWLTAVDWDSLDVDVTLAGNWQYLPDDSPLKRFVAHDIAECCPNTETADLYRRSAASLNVYRHENTSGTHDGWAMGPREVELAACGTFYLTEERGENRDVLPMVPTVSSPGEFAEALTWWLDHPRDRQKVADAACGAVAGRTFLSNAMRLLELVA